MLSQHPASWCAQSRGHLKKRSCQHLLSLHGWEDVLAAVSPGKFPMHNSQTGREYFTWAKCLYQWLNTSKWNKECCHHNKKKLPAPSPASQPTSRMPGMCGMSHIKAKPILQLFHLLRRIKMGEEEEGKGNIKLHWPEVLKYERGSTRAQARELCLFGGGGGGGENKKNTST